MHATRARRIRIALSFGAALLVLVAWWWPGLTGQDEQTDVLVFGTNSLQNSKEAIDRKLREEGFTTLWEPRFEGSCSFGPPSRSGFEVLVLDIPDSRRCDPETLAASLSELEAAVENRPIVVVLPWLDGDRSGLAKSVSSERFRVVDVGLAIGEVGALQECSWWDDCPEGGRIATIEDGMLTEAGEQRLARAIVTAVLR